MANRAKRCFDYLSKCYGLDTFVRGIKDSRVGAQIPAGDRILILLIGVMCRLGSLNQIEEAVKAGYFKRILSGKFSADTMSRALWQILDGQLEGFNDEIIKKARRNKIYRKGTIEGYKVAAIDGTELYTTKAEERSCCDCSKRKLNSGEVEYYERVVILSYVGDGPPLIIGMKRLKQNQGETTGAIELVKELYQRHFRYCDVITADSLYAIAPFIHACTDQNKDVVIRVKREDRNIIQDAKWLFRQRGPDEALKDVSPKDEGYSRYRYDLRIWDEENLTSWSNVKRPLRCLEIEEVRREVSTGTEKRQTIHLVTTLPKATASSRVVWKIAHRRWDIENSVINDLKTNWHFEHSYCHINTRAVTTMWQIIMIAFNLFMLWAHRRNSDHRSSETTLIGLARGLLIGIAGLPTPIWSMNPRAPT